MAKTITLKKTKNKLKIFVDPIGNTLNLWWGDPKDSRSAYEAEDSWDVIALDKNKKAIGLEKIGFFPKEIEPLALSKDIQKILIKNNIFIDS